MDNWQSIPLIAAAKIFYGSTPQNILSDNGKYEVIGTGLSSRWGNNYLYEGETIIIGRKGTIDRPVFKSGKIWVIDTAYYLKIEPNIHPKFLFYLLSQIDFNHLNESTGVPSLSRKNLYNVKLYLPKSFDEQKIISKIISSVEDQIKCHEMMIEKYQRIKTGLMQDLLTKGIDENGNIRSEKTHKFKDSPVGRIPVEWDVVQLGEEKYFSLATGGTPSTAIQEYWVGGDIPWLSSGEVHRKIIRYSDNFITKLGYDHSNARFYPINSVLMALAGQGKTRGTVAITEIETTSNQSVAAIIPNKNYVDAYYLYYLLDTMYEELRSISSGSGRAGLSLRILREINIKLPPYDEQQRIAEIIVKTDDIINIEKVALNKSLMIKNGLMQDLLSGKVRVNKEVSNV